MIRMYSKYERRTDTRTYDDRKKLYEGGWEVIRAESLDAIWKEKFEEFSKRPAKKLPKWLGGHPRRVPRRHLEGEVRGVLQAPRQRIWRSSAPSPSTPSGRRSTRSSPSAPPTYLEVIRAESLDAIWKEKYEEFSKRPANVLGGHPR